MEMTSRVDIRFPRDLVEWTGHHSGGVKRLFDSLSGRPTKGLIRTNLISKMEFWASCITSGVCDAPRLILLVGGPGNGKTDAIEHAIKCLDDGLEANGKLVATLKFKFHPPIGQAVPRVVQVDAGSYASVPRSLNLFIVQDASVTAGQEGKTTPVLLIEELCSLLASSDSYIYLCCVNRGVLDDALIYAIDNNLNEARNLIESITRSVSLSATAPACWPLEGFPALAVWPMDAESLLIVPEGASVSPAAALFEYATNPVFWSTENACTAGAKCPFCHNQNVLARDNPRKALLKMLRWYELASGKRWSFRDLLSLTSYLLAGHSRTKHGAEADPCDYAAHLLTLDNASKLVKNPKREGLTAIFNLVTLGYQHALFHRWNTEIITSLRQDVKDLELSIDKEVSRVIFGLLFFLQERKKSYLPATISSLLDNFSNLLDPALASPDITVMVSERSSIILCELDERFSRSLAGGIKFISKYKKLSVNELELLNRLAEADLFLSSPSIRRKRPAAAGRIQRLLRDFACRLVRRSICARSAVVPDAEILSLFQNVVEDVESKSLFEVAQQVKNLLNSRYGFEVSLTTTFGQPLPPQQRQSILVVQPQPVRPLPLSDQGRPRSPICFLQVGHGHSSQPIALTYDLFKAVRELERGLSPASLPRAVVALLDTTRSRLSGPIVRDQDILTDAIIRIGSDGVEIGKSWNGFVAMKTEGKA